MSLHLITNKVSIYHKKIHPICSLLFESSFSAATVGILTGLAVSVCEELPSPNRGASLLHRSMVRQLDV
jgi:hypothetical protein